MHADLRAGHAVVLLNKPYGVLCQFTDTAGRGTLADFVDIPEVYPAGRLDADSEGLVVLTASGRLQARLAQPRFKLHKTYWAQVEGLPSHEQLAALVDGVVLRDGPACAVDARAIAEPAHLWPRAPPIRVRKAIPTAWIVAHAGRRPQPTGAAHDRSGGAAYAASHPLVGRRVDARRTCPRPVARGSRAMIARLFAPFPSIRTLQ